MFNGNLPTAPSRQTGETIVVNWEQREAVHCPDVNCKGMLFQSDFCHEQKCSDCGKYWMGRTQYVETQKPKQEQVS